MSSKYYVFIFLFFAILLLLSCNPYRLMQRKIVRPHDFVNTKVDTLNLDEHVRKYRITKENYSFRINHLNNELIKNINMLTHLSVKEKKTAIRIVNSGIHNTKIVKSDDSIRSGMLPLKFLNYMPNTPEKFRKPNWYVGKYFTNIFYYYSTQIPFKIKSNQFPQNFSFPSDYLYSTIEIRNIHLDTVYKPSYLILNLPKYINVNVFWKKRVYPRYVNGYRQEYIPIHLENRHLLLNPAFKATYTESTEFIWKLYLFRIKYNVLGDTLHCNGELPVLSRKKLRKVDTYLFVHPCHPNLYSPNVKTYLKKAIQNQPELYKSYFELIFWQMYQPKDFKIKDNKGEERSFTFTSTSKRFPGKYKVKFNIYRPYEFKVKRR